MRPVADEGRACSLGRSAGEKAPVLKSKRENSIEARRAKSGIGALALSLLLGAGASHAWCQIAPVRILPAARAPAPPRADDAAQPGDEPGEEYRGAADPLFDSGTDALLGRVRDHIKAEDWAQAVHIIDEVLGSIAAPQGRLVEPRRRPRRPPPDAPRAADGGPDSEVQRSKFALERAVTSDDGILFRPLGVAVRKQLLGWPEEARRLYTGTHQPAAREALKEAEAGDVENAVAALRRVAVRYPLTDAGGTAWHLLGLRLLDADRPAAAGEALEAAGSVGLSSLESRFHFSCTFWSSS